MALELPEQGPLRVGLQFGRETANKLVVVAEMLGGFESHGQVCRYLMNRGIESMSAQIAAFQTQKRLREILEEQKDGGQEIFEFLKKAAEERDIE